MKPIEAGVPSLPVVLLIEDERGDAELIRWQLLEKSDTAFDVAMADSLAAGQQLIDKGDLRPDVVLLDLNLPIYSGFEVLQWLRQQPQYRDLTVVTFSSSGRDEDRERARQLGATDYLLKPSSGLQFVEIVKLLKERWLKNSAPPPPPGPAGLSPDTLQGAN